VIAKCQVRDEAADLTDDVIICCLVRATAYLCGDMSREQPKNGNQQGKTEGSPRRTCTIGTSSNFWD
jgi:hypothetical protein